MLTSGAGITVSCPAVAPSAAPSAIDSVQILQQDMSNHLSPHEKALTSKHDSELPMLA